MNLLSPPTFRQHLQWAFVGVGTPNPPGTRPNSETCQHAESQYVPTSQQKEAWGNAQARQHHLQTPFLLTSKLEGDACRDSRQGSRGTHMARDTQRHLQQPPEGQSENPMACRGARSSAFRASFLQDEDNRQPSPQGAVIHQRLLLRESH